ncbi:DUF4440 domain-containing protein [Pontibacter sp. HSC-14F20]|uniref:YybH family protein n=1 Tax=Pontibacter sp. HSC-14F20 TaxID=2864136 RepID=UPI001C7388E6|nr:DUF4440 domain-containing protein [Pontibacter sp. HSC-14F20]MBX0333389.1 DUF4440 domain-containing protein [Pontibacter sp. HSC-14F20]
METVTTDISTNIRSANEKFMRAFSNGNAAGIANLYTDEGMLLPTGMEMIKGKQGIQEFWQGAMDMGIKNVRLETLEVQPCENTAIEMGNYTLRGEGDSLIDRGKYMVIWQKKHHNWKLDKDIWNSSVSAT